MELDLLRLQLWWDFLLLLLLLLYPLLLRDRLLSLLPLLLLLLLAPLTSRIPRSRHHGSISSPTPSKALRNPPHRASDWNAPRRLRIFKPADIHRLNLLLDTTEDPTPLNLGSPIRLPSW